MLGARPIRIKNGAYRSTILEHRIIVGASIARPVLGARPIRIENGNRRFRVSPTGDIAEIFTALACCFTSLQIPTDGRPMAAPTGAVILVCTIILQRRYIA